MGASIPNAVLIHLVTAIPAAVLGAFILWREKGTMQHKFLGRLWAALMLITAVDSFGIQSDGRLSWLHILSVISIVAIVYAIVAIRKGNRRAHRLSMQSAYAGLMIAFVFTLLPNRLLGQWVRQFLG